MGGEEVQDKEKTLKEILKKDQTGLKEFFENFFKKENKDPLERTGEGKRRETVESALKLREAKNDEEKKGQVVNVLKSKDVETTQNGSKEKAKPENKPEETNNEENDATGSTTVEVNPYNNNGENSPLTPAGTNGKDQDVQTKESEGLKQLEDEWLP